MVNHRRFLKNINENFKYGGYFPERLLADASGKVLMLTEISHSKKGSLVFLMGTNCDACNFELITKFHLKYRQFNYYILVQDDHELFKYNGDLDINVEFCNIPTVSRQLNYSGLIPMVFIINPKGQIIGGSIFNDMEILEAVAWPLIRVAEN